MTARPALGGSGRAASFAGLGLIVVAAAAAVGGATAVDVRLGIGLAGAAILVAVIGARPESVLVILIALVYVEDLTVSGVTVTRLLAPVLLVFLVFAWIAGSARLPSGAPLYWTLAYALWCVSSLIWTVGTGRTFDLLVSLAIGLVFAACVACLVDSPDRLRLALGTLCVAATISAIVGIAEYAMGTVERADGLIGDPNVFAAYQLLALPVIAVLIGRAPGGGHRALLGAAGLVIGTSVVVSLSRGGMLALAIVGVAALLTPTGWIFPSGRQRIAALLIVVVCAPVALTLTSGQFGSRVEDLQGQDSTGSGRVNLWRAAWTSIEERPILGLGYGAFSTVSNDLMLETPETDLSDFVIREQGPEAHNSYVGTAAELGVVGLVLFLAMIASIITLFWRIARQELQRGPPPETAQRRRPSLRGSAAAAFVVGLAGWLAGGIFLSLEVVRPFWIILGLALALGALGTDRRAGDDHGAVRTGT